MADETMSERSPEDLVRSLYLGDRACKAIHLRGWRQQIAVQVDCISRIPTDSAIWDFDTSRDIEDGWIVFTDVSDVRFSPAGPVPNDLISSLAIRAPTEGLDGGREYRFVMSIASVDRLGVSREVLVEIQARGIHLENPRTPDDKFY